MFGGDCYAYGLLAMGFADLVVEASLEPYDFMAPAAVVEGAGGSFTDWQGEPVHLGSPGRMVAAGDPRLQARRPGDSRASLMRAASLTGRPDH